jgi:TldD protein
MIDRRRFVQSMLALGAAAGTRSSTVLLAAPPNDEVSNLADAGLSAAKRAGASYADIRINRYRNQFIFTRDRRVQNIVNTEDYGFGVRSSLTGPGALRAAASSRRRKLPVSRPRRCRLHAPTSRSTPRPCSWRGRAVQRHLEHPVVRNPFDMPLQPKLDLLMHINEEALKVPGASFVSAFMQFVHEHKYFASTDGSHIEQSLIRSYPSFNVTAVDSAGGKFYARRALTAPMGMGTSTSNRTRSCRRCASRPRRPWRCTRPSRRRPVRKR